MSEKLPPIIGVVRKMRMHTETTKAMMAERIAIHGTLDYRFFHHWFENMSVCLKELEEVLEDAE